MSSVVLDSSAILAMILEEPGGRRVDALFDAVASGREVRVSVSAVNLCEVLTRIQREDRSIAPEELYAALNGAELVAFDEGSAELAAAYARVSSALSLGDRACLALANKRKATAWTADRLWATVSLDVPI